MSEKVDKIKLVGEINTLLDNGLSIREEIELLLLPDELLLKIKKLIQRISK